LYGVKMKSSLPDTSLVQPARTSPIKLDDPNLIWLQPTMTK
jgi:hypothetical protein